MPKKHTIIIYPHLNDRGGNFDRQWYVESSYRVPGEEKPRRERIYKGVNKGNAMQRYAAAEKIIQEKTAWLKEGNHLTKGNRRVYEDELLYRSEAKLYGSKREAVVTTRTNLSDFLRYIRRQVNDKTYSNYQSKMRAFNAWLERSKLDHLHVKNITRLHMIDFATYLSETEKLSRLSIDKYMQIIRAFFEYELDGGHISANPVKKIPKMGRVVDCSATPYSADERQRLKEAVKPADPQLWLACQIQYYCAIRPGTELRLMKVSWIDFDHNQLRVPCVEAKNNMTEIVEIPGFLAREMEEYGLRQCGGDLYVFGKFGRPGSEPLGKNTLRNRFNRYRDALGISPDHKFYSWKHSGAIELINAGAQPFDVMDHLRHKNFDTTEKYLKKRIKNKEKRINRFVKEI